MNIKKDTIIRTVVLAVALINMLLNAFGKNTLPFTSDEASAVISGIFTFVASMVAWWKNNSFTKNAIKADEYKAKLGSTDDTYSTL